MSRATKITQSIFEAFVLRNIPLTHSEDGEYKYSTNIGGSRYDFLAFYIDHYNKLTVQFTKNGSFHRTALRPSQSGVREFMQAINIVGSMIIQIVNKPSVNVKYVSFSSDDEDEGRVLLYKKLAQKLAQYFKGRVSIKQVRPYIEYTIHLPSSPEFGNAETDYDIDKIYRRAGRRREASLSQRSEPYARPEPPSRFGYFPQQPYQNPVASASETFREEYMTDIRSMGVANLNVKVERRGNLVFITMDGYMSNRLVENSDIHIKNAIDVLTYSKFGTTSMRSSGFQRIGGNRFKYQGSVQPSPSLLGRVIT
jgi:hypothetical protein